MAKPSYRAWPARVRRTLPRGPPPEPDPRATFAAGTPGARGARSGSGPGGGDLLACAGQVR